jgi:hypothetical protein
MNSVKIFTAFRMFKTFMPQVKKFIDEDAFSLTRFSGGYNAYLRDSDVKKDWVTNKRLADYPVLYE